LLTSVFSRGLSSHRKKKRREERREREEGKEDENGEDENRFINYSQEYGETRSPDRFAPILDG